MSLAPGRFYRHTWIFPICVAGLGLLILATPETSAAAYLEAIVLAAALVFASLALPAYYRRVRTVVVDSAGIRLIVGRRVRKDLPWAQISRIDLGPRHRVNGLLGVYDGFGFMAVGRNMADSINLVDTWFQVDPNGLPTLAGTVEGLATARSIPVYTRFGRW